MSVELRHAPLAKSGGRWLIQACNPLGSGVAIVRRFPAAQARDALSAAELHGVLPIVLRRLRQFEAAGEDPVAGRSATVARAIADARQVLVGQTGMELMLRHQAALVMHAFDEAGIQAIIIKGPVFARRLYELPSLRSFSDIDILIPPRCRAAAAECMSTLGFRAVDPAYRGSIDYLEDVWVLDNNERIGVEVHCNLAHNPKLRRIASVSYEDVLAAGGGDPEDATALLFVAASHGALSHQFDRLQHVVDVTLAASGAAGPINTQRLRIVAQKSGVFRAVVAALVLAHRTFGCEACRTIAGELNPGLLDRVAANLLTPATVADARSASRSMRSWRRKAFRQLLRTRISRAVP